MSPRPFNRVRLRVAATDRRPDEPNLPAVPWWAAAMVAALVVAGVGWLLITGLVVGAWATAMDGSVGAAVGLGTKLWLLVHGAPLRLGGLVISLTPLLLSLLAALGVAGAAAWAARRLSGAPAWTDGAAGRGAAKIAAVVTGTYVGIVLLALIAVGDVSAFGRGLVGALLVSGPAAFVGAGRALGYRPVRRWPAALRVVPLAAGAAVAVVALFGAAAVVTGLVQHSARIHTMEAALQLPPVARVLLGVVEFVFAPDLLLWGMSYVLGAGFRVGVDTVVSLSNVHVGLLPGVPVLGALPDNGIGHGGLLAWLLSGVAAGAVAGWLVVRSRPPARADETALVGGLSGVAGGLAVTALCALSLGSLGSERLADFGPRLLELFIFGTSTLGLAGMATGLVLGLLRRPVVVADDPDDAEETQPVDGR